MAGTSFDKFMKAICKEYCGRDYFCENHMNCSFYEFGTKAWQDVGAEIVVHCKDCAFLDREKKRCQVHKYGGNLPGYCGDGIRRDE